MRSSGHHTPTIFDPARSALAADQRRRHLRARGNVRKRASETLQRVQYMVCRAVATRTAAANEMLSTRIGDRVVLGEGRLALVTDDMRGVPGSPSRTPRRVHSKPNPTCCPGRSRSTLVNPEIVKMDAASFEGVASTKAKQVGRQRISSVGVWYEDEVISDVLWAAINDPSRRE